MCKRVLRNVRCWGAAYSSYTPIRYPSINLPSKMHCLKAISWEWCGGAATTLSCCAELTGTHWNESHREYGAVFVGEGGCHKGIPGGVGIVASESRASREFVLQYSPFYRPSTGSQNCSFCGGQVFPTETHGFLAGKPAHRRNCSSGAL